MFGLTPGKEPKQLTGYFLHITDFHPDTHYISDALVKLKCHHQRPSKLKKPAYMKKGISGPWGAEATICDSPINLINATFEWLEKNWKNKLDFIIWTGDNSRHDSDDLIPREPQEIYDLNQFITNKFLKTFTDAKTIHIDKRHRHLETIPIVPSIGNNDLFPSNIVSGGPNDVLTSLHEIWSQFIPTGQHQYFLKGGYYYVEVIPRKLIVVSLNTLYFYKLNTAVNGCKVETQPGTIQFRWLNNVLKKARKHGMKVYLTGHVAPRRNQYMPSCYKEYGKLAIKYHDIILGHYYGHSNMDHFFFISSKNKHKNEIINNSSNDSSTLPHKLQLNFQSSQTNINDDNYENRPVDTKIYDVDKPHEDDSTSPAHSNLFLTPLGYTQYFINLTEANQYPNITPEFKVEYNTWDDYNMKDLTVSSWIHLARRIANHGLGSSLWEKVREYLMTSSSNRVIEAKSPNESVQILIKIFNKYKNIDLEISKGFLEQFYFISNEIKLHTTNRIGNEEYNDFDVEKLVETKEFEFFMDKLYLIVEFNSNHMTNDENQEDVNTKDKLRDYLQSLRVLTNELTLNTYKLKTTSTNDEIINDRKERINVTKIIDVLFFNKENLDLGHDNLVSLNNPIEIVDDNNKSERKNFIK
ncbi:14659_t:CDS:2 [Entrophospora sp. SA101]|nr:14659_t:CDS:2 [Entrophospora sp. SA101]CAJ0908786.1 15244_t:CDS:2 [Entrophospora sp. SA101]